MLDLRTGKVCKTLIPKVTNKSIWVAPNVNCSCRWRKESLTYLQYSTRQTSLSFTTTGSLTFSIFWTQYVNSGRKTIRAFRRKDGKLIANFRVQVSLLHLNLSSVYLFSMFFTLVSRPISKVWRQQQMEGLKKISEGGHTC